MCISGIALIILKERSLGFTGFWGRIAIGMAKNGGFPKKWAPMT